jgi:hypothetical protein
MTGARAALTLVTSASATGDYSPRHCISPANAVWYALTLLGVPTITQRGDTRHTSAIHGQLWD